MSTEDSVCYNSEKVATTSLFRYRPKQNCRFSYAKYTLEPFVELAFVLCGFFVEDDLVSLSEGPGFSLDSGVGFASDLIFGFLSDLILGLVSDLTKALSAVFPFPFLDLLRSFFTVDLEDFAILLELLTS